MTHEDFIKGIEDTYKKGVALIKIKNKDYAGADDPWKNFKTAELVGIDYKKAILVRVTDKLSRISNLLTREAEVKDELVDDTILDCVNYMAILLEAIKNERK